MLHLMIHLDYKENALHAFAISLETCLRLVND